MTPGAITRWFIAALAFLISAGIAEADTSARNFDKWHGWWELGGYYGSDDSSRGELVLFTPIMQTATTLLFTDIRGKLFEHDVQEGNVALGYRQMLDSGWNLGIWGGFDVRNTDTENKFWQASVGLEALSDRWDVRVNGYAPLTGPKGSPSLARAFLSGNQVLMTGGREVPLHGIDGEIGFNLFGGHRGGGLKDGRAYGRRAELRVYGGGFWFDDNEALEQVAGPKARIEFRIEDIIASLPGSRLTLEGEVSHDDVRDDKWEIGARLRIPFGGSRQERAVAHASLSAQERRMTEGLERDTDIVTGASSEENVGSTETGQLVTSATQVTPGTDAATVATAAGAGGMVIINGAINQNGSIISMAAGQIVAGGGTAIPVFGAKSGTAATFIAPGPSGTLGGGTFPGGDSIRTASNTLVAGLNFVNNVVSPSSHVVIADDTNVTVRDTVHSVTSNVFGITISSSTGVVVRNVDMTALATTSNGLRMEGSNVSVAVENFSYAGTLTLRGTAISVFPNGVNTVSLNNVSARNATFGLAVNTNPGNTLTLAVDNSTFTSNGTGVSIGIGAGTINLSGASNSIVGNTTDCSALAGPTINGTIGATPANCP